MIDNTNSKLTDWMGAYISGVSKLVSVLEKAAALMGILLAVVVVYQVIARYLFQSSAGWAIEVSIYLAIYMTFIYTGTLIKKDNHLQIEVLFNRFSLSTKYWIRQFQLICVLIVGFLFFYYGFIYAVESGFQSISLALGVSNFWFYLSLPFIGLLVVIISSCKMMEIYMDAETIERDYSERYSGGPSEQDMAVTGREQEVIADE